MRSDRYEADRPRSSARVLTTPHLANGEIYLIFNWALNFKRVNFWPRETQSRGVRAGVQATRQIPIK